MTLTDALAAVRAYRFLSGTEEDLQRLIAEAFTREGIVFEREFNIGAAGRIDFYLPAWRAGVEVKVGGSPAAALRQLHRYAGVDGFDALVLMTRRARLGGLPDRIGDKPLHVVTLWECGL